MAEEVAQEEMLNLCTTVSWSGTVTCLNKQVFNIKADRMCTKGGRFISPNAFNKGDQALITLSPLLNGKSLTLQAVVKVTHIHLLHGNLGHGIGFSFVKAPKTLEALIEKLVS